MASTRKPSTAGGATRVSVAATAMIALRKMSLLSELDEEDLGGADEARSVVATYSHHLPGWLRVPWPPERAVSSALRSTARSIASRTLASASAPTVPFVESMLWNIM